MRPHAMFLLAILFTPMAVRAQSPPFGVSGMENPAANSGQAPAKAAGSKAFSIQWNDTVASFLNAARCPVAMHAQQRGWAGELRTRQFIQPGQSTPPPKPPSASQRIRLTLTGSSGDNRVVSAEVSVRGTSGVGHATSLLATPSAPAFKMQTLTLNFSKDEDSAGVFSDMLLKGFTSVSWIRLDSISYADGSIWTPESGDSCQAAPDPLVLVAGR